MRRLAPALGALLATLVWGAGSVAHADGSVGTVRVRLDPTTASIRLGASLDLRITVTNDGRAPSPRLVLHLDVTDPGRSTSVDPEDWTSTLSKPIGIVAPGDSVTVHWRVQPISSGTFSTYAVVLSPGADDLASSNVAHVHVAAQRALNPGGILVAAAGTPAVVGALLLLRLRRPPGGRRARAARGRRTPVRAARTGAAPRLRRRR